MPNQFFKNKEQKLPMTAEVMHKWKFQRANGFMKKCSTSVLILSKTIMKYHSLLIREITLEIGPCQVLVRFGWKQET
jgi:hypothetical protein